MDLKKLINCLTSNEKEILRQILIESDNNKTDIYTFISQNEIRPNMRFALISLRESEYHKIKYIEDITKIDFIKCPGVYLRSWETFSIMRKTNKTFN